MKEGFIDTHELAPSTFGISKEEEKRIESLFEEYWEFFFTGFLLNSVLYNNYRFETDFKNLILFSSNYKDKQLTEWHYY